MIQISLRTYNLQEIQIELWFPQEFTTLVEQHLTNMSQHIGKESAHFSWCLSTSSAVSWMSNSIYGHWPLLLYSHWLLLLIRSLTTTFYTATGYYFLYGHWPLLNIQPLAKTQYTVTDHYSLYSHWLPPIHSVQFPGCHYSSTVSWMSLIIHSVQLNWSHSIQEPVVKLIIVCYTLLKIECIAMRRFSLTTWNKPC